MHTIDIKGFIRIEKQQFPFAQNNYNEWKIKEKSSNFQNMVEGMMMPDSIGKISVKSISKKLQIFGDNIPEVNEDKCDILFKIRFKYADYGEYKKEAYNDFKFFAKTFNPVYIYFEEDAEIDGFHQVKQYILRKAKNPANPNIKWKISIDTLESP